jgi:hypothetical protein
MSEGKHTHLTVVETVPVIDVPDQHDRPLFKRHPVIDAFVDFLAGCNGNYNENYFLTFNQMLEI